MSRRSVSRRVLVTGLSAGALTLGCLCGTSAAQVLSPEQQVTLDSVAEAERQAYGAPGMAVAVLRSGEVPLQFAIGLSDVETGAPMTAEMLGSVASLSKFVTATTALALAVEGRLDLAAPIHNYLPELPPRLGSATMTQLLSNMAGLIEFTPRISPAPAGSLSPICAGMSDDALIANPGEVWGYSNTGFTLAGCVIEAVSDLPFPAAVERYVFEPVRMNRSTYSSRMAMTYPHAQGHDTRVSPPVVVRPYNSNPRIAPAGELITTVGDLVKLAQVFISDGMLGGERVLPEGTLDSLSYPRAAASPFLLGGRQYGFGMFIRPHRGFRIVEHEGIYGGFGASIAIVPEAGVAAVAISNGRYGAPVRTTQAALELAMGMEPSSAERSDEPATFVGDGEVLGLYANATGSIEIRERDGSLHLVQGERAFPMREHPDGHWLVPGHPGIAPLPANIAEPVRGPDGSVHFLRLGWRLYRRAR